MRIDAMHVSERHGKLSIAMHRMLHRRVLNIVNVCRRQPNGVSIDRRMRCKHSPHLTDPDDGHREQLSSGVEQLIPLSARCCRGGIRRGTDSKVPAIRRSLRVSYPRLITPLSHLAPAGSGLEPLPPPCGL